MPRKFKKKPVCKKRVQNHGVYCTHINEFNAKLDNYGLHLVDVVGDGNCMFRAIADQMEGKEHKHERYRKMAVCEIRRHQLFYSNFLPGIVMKEYLELIAEDGVWGGHLELQALCNSLNIDIVVHSLQASILITGNYVSTCNVWKVLGKYFSCFAVDPNAPRKTINIAFHKGPNIIEHYSSIRYQGDADGAAQPIHCDTLKELMRAGQPKKPKLKPSKSSMSTDLENENENMPQSSFDQDRELLNDQYYC